MFYEVIYKNNTFTVGNEKIKNTMKELVNKKISSKNIQISSLYEEHLLFIFSHKSWTQRKFWNFFCWFFYEKYRKNHDTLPKVETALIVFWDMLGLYKAWRHAKGYPVNGQRTWSNGKSCSKNNVFLRSFRLKQFQTVFGIKKKTSYAVMIQAEINNRLWLKTWPAEWLQGHKHAVRSKSRKGFTIPIDLANLARGTTTGYLRRGQASKWNKSKKALKTVTIGLPVFFSRYFFSVSKKKFFKYQLTQLQPEFKGVKMRKKKPEKTFVKTKKQKRKEK